MEYVTPGGLTVVDHRRALDDAPIVPNDNPPLGTVGPNVPSGFGDTHALYPSWSPPFEAQHWDGWPVGWQTPGWGQAGWLNTRVSTVMLCVDFLSRNMATFPMVVTRASVPLMPQPLWTLNPEPAVYASVADWVRQTVNSLLLRGEAIIAATWRKADGFPGRWITLNPDLVTVETRDGVNHYSIGAMELAREDVCHVRYQSWPGVARGVGPLEWLGRTLLGVEALETYAANLAARGGIPWGVLRYPNTLSKEQTDSLRERWLEAAASRSGAPAILSGGFELDTLTINPRDMSLLEMRTFDEARIASAFGVFPFVVGLPMPNGSLVYQNVSQLYEGMWRQTMRPLAMNISQALSQWALPYGTTVYFDSDAFTRPTLVERSSSYETLVSMGAMTIEEVRALENMGPLPDAAEHPPEPVGQLTSGIG